jgi:hypothetical protein
MYSPRDGKVLLKNDEQFKKMLFILEQTRFYKTLDHFAETDMLDLFRSFELRKVKPGFRFFESTDKLDSFVLVLRGKIGIFYPEIQLKEAVKHDHRVVCCNEADVRRK